MPLTELAKTRSTALVNRFTDFWLLGGASILVWALLAIGQRFRDYQPVEGHFIQIGAFFSLLSLVCNYPHFMMSYRFGYGRGGKFILSHWLTLIAVPLALVVIYAVAYFNFDAQIANLSGVGFVNHMFEKTGLGFRLGTLTNFGTEILSLSIWLMFATVGWHYSKQVFGCMAVYAHYDNYPLTRFQRNVIKAALFGLAFFNFFYFSVYAPEYNDNQVERGYFMGVPAIPLGLPTRLIPIAAVTTVVLGLGILFFVILRNYIRLRRLPSVNFLVAWVAFYIWWIPPIRQAEFYFMAVPFFHSLQYLPFAYRLERPRFPHERRGNDIRLTLRVGLLLLVGFLAFELVPNLLDTGLDTAWRLKEWFFLVAFVVFLNVHHFFIDSVVWKFKQSEVRDYLLAG